jgi:hypothetical protein
VSGLLMGLLAGQSGYTDSEVSNYNAKAAAIVHELDVSRNKIPGSY